MGRSDQMKTGDVVLAIGNPYGLGHSVTQGIVSATGRAQLGLFTFENFIQTDAAINEGNSGGALVNTDGELVGINTAVLSASLMPDGISFAIPVNLVRGVSQQLITHGRVIRGWLGVSPQNLSAQRSEDIGIPGTIGIELYDVNGDGPGFRAGLRPGDVITRIDTNVIRFSRDALNLVAGMSPGSEILIDGLRDGRSFQVSAVIEERPPIP
jgi:S1-C subfamily serine protease